MKSEHRCDSELCWRGRFLHRRHRGLCFLHISAWRQPCGCVKDYIIQTLIIYEKDEDDPAVPTSQTYEVHMVSGGTSSTGSNNILFSTYSNGDTPAFWICSFLSSCHFSPDSAKKARGCSATGFTQKRHTLYAYYSRGKSEFQMLFFTDFGSGTRLHVCECCLRHLHVFSPFSPPVPPDGRCVLLPPVRRSRARLPPVLSPCPTPA